MARSKYGNVRTTVDGITFASKAEAKRYGELRLLERGKQICMLTLQPRFPLIVGGKRVAFYIADFAYFEGARKANSPGVCEDVKGKATPVFRLKWEMVQALYPDIDWRLIPAKSTRATSAGSRRAA